MAQIAFVFSGQGDQYPGMGRELFERYDAARRVFETCETLRPGTVAQCFSGTEAELSATRNTQPCLFAMELAAAAVLAEKGIRPAAMAGFSLGEVTAAAAAGLLDRETAFRLVCRRGELMQAAAQRQETAMAAVLKLPEEAVEALCARQEGVYPVNYNCPGQITVSGLAARMPAFFQAVREAGGRAVPLKVTGAFHSPFMKEAAEAFGRALEEVTCHTPSVPLYSDVTAEPYGEDPKELLARQICRAVRWEAIVRGLLARGVNTFVEIGPGRTLGGMIRRIDGAAAVYAVSEMEKLLAEVGAC